MCKNKASDKGGKNKQNDIGAVEMGKSREEIMRMIAEKYNYFLQTLNFDDEMYMKGMGEARGKFVANLHIAIMKEEMPKKYKDRRYSADYVSERALKHLETREWKAEEIQYEHMIPKTKYIKEVCEEATKNGVVTTDFIYDVLMKNLWIATVHKDEERLLKRLGLGDKMPSDWDEKNIFARYERAGIELKVHDRSYMPS